MWRVIPLLFWCCAATRSGDAVLGATERGGKKSNRTHGFFPMNDQPRPHLLRNRRPRSGAAPAVTLGGRCCAEGSRAWLGPQRRRTQEVGRVCPCASTAGARLASVERPATARLASRPGPARDRVRTVWWSCLPAPWGMRSHLPSLCRLRTRNTRLAGRGTMWPSGNATEWRWGRDIAPLTRISPCSISTSGRRARRDCRIDAPRR